MSYLTITQKDTIHIFIPSNRYYQVEPMSGGHNLTQLTSLFKLAEKIQNRQGVFLQRQMNVSGVHLVLKIKITMTATRTMEVTPSAGNIAAIPADVSINAASLTARAPTPKVKTNLMP